MFAFIVRRTLQSIIVMLIIAFVGFSVQHNLGDPTKELVGQRVTLEERNKLRDKLGLNDPFLVQYFRFVKKAITGDLGTSLHHKKPCLEVIAGKAPATLEMVFVSAFLVIIICLPVGVFTAIYSRHWLSKVILSISTVGVAVPVFIIALVLIYIFGITLGWLPTYGRGEVVDLGWWSTGFFSIDGWSHLVLPSVSLASLMLPLFIRLIRTEMMEVLQTEYIKFAWAKGLKAKRVWFVHALKNTLLPVITVFGVQVGILFAFTLLTEHVFQWPGIGYMFLEAINRSDSPLIVAYLVVVGCMFVVVNTVVDVLYGFVNPTVRVAGSK